ncbi:MAG: SDR family NAD(P)-dependent oxidoreductase [Geminicoccaceae bacterium]
MRDQILKGRTAIVTGSGQNIGKAIAKMFAAAGANLVINGRSNRKIVDETVDEIRGAGGSAIGIMADVSDPVAVNDMVAEAECRFGTVDIAVSNVSIRRKQPFLEITPQDWDDTLRINLTSCYHLAQATIPLMMERSWGRLIMISGIDGWAAHIPARAHNIVAKAGMHALAKSLALEFGAFGITSNTVSPGPIDTTRDWTQYPEGWAEMRKKQVPSGQLGHVDDIAQACLYLVGPNSGFTTGQVIHVNGGLFMY